MSPFSCSLTDARSPDIIVEVAHPDVVKNFGVKFLEISDLMVRFNDLVFFFRGTFLCIFHLSVFLPGLVTSGVILCVSVCSGVALCMWGGWGGGMVPEWWRVMVPK